MCIGRRLPRRPRRVGRSLRSRRPRGPTSGPRGPVGRSSDRPVVSPWAKLRLTGPTVRKDGRASPWLCPSPWCAFWGMDHRNERRSHGSPPRGGRIRQTKKAPPHRARARRRDGATCTCPQHCIRLALACRQWELGPNRRLGGSSVAKLRGSVMPSTATSCPPVTSCNADRHRELPFSPGRGVAHGFHPNEYDGRTPKTCLDARHERGISVKQMSKRAWALQAYCRWEAQGHRVGSRRRE